MTRYFFQVNLVVVGDMNCSVQPWVTVLYSALHQLLTLKSPVTQWCHTKDFGVLYTVLSVTGGTSIYRLPCSPSWSRDLWRHRQMTRNHHDVLLHTSNHATLPSLSCTANTVLICSIRITNNAIWSHLLATVIPINIRKPIGLSCLSVCENETSVSYSSS